MAVNSGKKVKGAKRSDSAAKRLELLLEKDPRDAGLHFELGQLMASSPDEHDKETAEHELEKALSLKKDFAEAAEALAGLLVPKNTQKAVKLYGKAADLYRERGDEGSCRRVRCVAATVVADEGWELRRGGDNSKARQKAVKALEICPDHVDAMNLIALVHMEDFEYDRARDTYEKAVEAAVKEQKGKVKIRDVEYWSQMETRPYMRARHGYGFSLAYLGRHKEALDQFNLLLKIDPQDNVGARFLLADLYHFTGDIKKAEKYYTESGSPDAAFNYALLLRCVGREQEARLTLKRACNKSPVVRSMLSEYLYCFLLWETLESYRWGTFPPLDLHRNALEMAYNANAHRSEDGETYSRLESAYNFCNLCGPLWLKYPDSLFFLTEGHPASS